jgi:CheY-like chemotaxis protein
MALSLHILLVDGSKILCATPRHTFEEIPAWTVCGEAVDGRDAVKQAQQFSPDVLVMDLSMPMFTTYKIEGLEKEATAAGCKAVRCKFEAVHLLLDTINALLGASVGNPYRTRLWESCPSSRHNPRSQDSWARARGSGWC